MSRSNVNIEVQQLWGMSLCSPVLTFLEYVRNQAAEGLFFSSVSVWLFFYLLLPVGAQTGREEGREPGERMLHLHEASAAATRIRISLTSASVGSSLWPTQPHG